VNVPTRLDQKNFDLGEVTIQKGQTIKWKNVEGIVQSLVQASGDANWFSPYMNKGSFYKRFDGVGVYSYQIIYADYIFNGKIIVQ
jgi:plastocyanin